MAIVSLNVHPSYLLALDCCMLFLSLIHMFLIISWVGLRPMNDELLNKRLSQITTVWALVQKAHAGPGDDEAEAQRALVERYQRAVYRYLLGALQNADAADEVFQEFALRLVRGDFRRADPERGRFRNFVRTALINLITDYHKRQARQRAAPLEGQDPAAAAGLHDSDLEFLQTWREELLARTWEALEASQKRTGQPYYTVLHYRSEHPKTSSAEMAKQLSKQLKLSESYTDAGIRKILQRAREKFADLLVDEVAQSLQPSTLDQVAEELADLSLLPYCQTALERRRQGSKREA
jgi:RNA polymerase sigma-70 factor (ECF subfamily)